MKRSRSDHLFSLHVSVSQVSLLSSPRHFSSPRFAQRYRSLFRGMSNSGIIAAIVIPSVLVASISIGSLIWGAIVLLQYYKKHGLSFIRFSTGVNEEIVYPTMPNSELEMATVERFLSEIAREKPIRFSPRQLAGFTRNYSIRLGSGGFGSVYKGELPNRVLVAVKVLNGSLDKRVEQQFMAEIGTIGRTYHINLVRLYGFCFHPTVRALVYEYMENGSLDRYLFDKKNEIEWRKLHEIAIGTAKGIAYLHEECQHMIIHYDIKPANILLDANFSPKVADFGLAKLCNRENTHVSIAGGRGTPGYAAPEMWMPSPVTHKCDVYSFGISLFEIVGRRRNLDVNQNGSDEWFPKLVWKSYENRQLSQLVSLRGVEESEEAEKMCKIALWCVQYQPEARPPMSKVVKMLEGGMDITPPPNPFQHLLSSGMPMIPWSTFTNSTTTPETTTARKGDCTPLMKKYGINIATTS